MKNTGVILAMLAAFTAGAVVCAFPHLSGVAATPAVVIPHRSIVPRSGFGSVEDAYAAIPHRRTALPNNANGLGQIESDYLVLMFELLDQAIVARVDAVRQLGDGQPVAPHIDAYTELLDCADAITAPATLAHYHRSIRKALVTQRAVIQKLHRQAVLGSNGLELGSFSGVQASSSLLKQAYSILTNEFPTVSQTVQEAFFDYHCALDFI